MTQEIAFALHAAMIGIGATLFMDLWALIQARALGIPSADYAMVGRWISHMPKGRFAHEAIARAPAVRGERPIGWIAHYATGILFAALLLALFGLGWARSPTPWPALVVGVATVAAPFLVLHPAFGAGVAGSRTPAPAAARARSLVAHFSFGVGLYVAAIATSRLLPSVIPA